MTRRPIYMKNNNKSYLLIFLLLALVGWLFFYYDSSSMLDSLVTNSQLKEKKFQGVVEEVIVDEGQIKAYFIKETDSPLVSISFIFSEVGSAYDPKGKEGLAKLVASSMMAGAGKMSSENLFDYIGVKGINISFSADLDSFSGQMTSARNNFSDAILILNQILISPRFEKKYVENNKDVMIKSLLVEKENPVKELGLAFNEVIYNGHPYGKNPLGSKDSIKSITHNDLISFVKNNLSKSNLYIGIAGNISKSEAKDAIKKLFGDLIEKNKTDKIGIAKIDWKNTKLTIKRDGIGQNIASYVARGTCRKCDDFYPLYIANYLFGGSGLNSKLNQRIREKEGLTYGGYSSLVQRDNANLIIAGFSATSDKYVQAEELFKDEWLNAGKNGFTEYELQSAKKYLTSSYNLRFASTIGIAEMLAYMQRYDLGLDFLQKRNQYVENVTLKQLNKVAMEYFTEELLQAEIGSF